MDSLREAARDLAYLLDRGYPERASLKLVGDRFDLNAQERELLLRAVVPQARARLRKAKRVRARDIRGASVGIDGYNVLATLSHALKGYPLVLCRDGFVRDAVKAGRRVHLNLALEPLLACLERFFKRYPPAFLGFYFDAPVSGSGELAAEVRFWLKSLGLSGTALAVPEAEKRVLEHEILCSADGPLLDRASRVFDLAGFLIRHYLRRPLIRPFR